MSTLKNLEKTQLEDLLGMESGYVLDFSDRTFDEFFRETVGMNIYADKYALVGGSKAKRLRAFWELEPDHIVAEVVTGLLEQWIYKHPQPNSVESALAAGCRRIVERLAASDTATIAHAKTVAEVLDASYLQRQVRRMEEGLKSDVELAVGTAKEFVETICKTILEESGVTLAPKHDMPKLVKRTMKQLKLTPDGIPDTAKGADTIRVLLSNLATIVNGLAELRNLYGSGHGKHAKSGGLNRRHAKLAVGAATTLGVFLFETFMDRGEAGLRSATTKPDVTKGGVPATAAER